jgi:type IV pilus assembly protein PilM
MPITMPKVELPSWLRMPSFPGLGMGAAGRSPLMEPKLPAVAFDIDHKSIAMVRIGRRKVERFIASWEVVEMPADIIELDFGNVRLADPARFTELIRGLVARNEGEIDRASILLPDSFSRVAILSLDQLPRRRADALEMIRWKTKKSVPFKVDKAAVDFMVLPSTGPGLNILAVLTPRTVIEAFEAAFTSLEIHAGLVDLNTLSLLNLYRPIFDKEIVNGSEFMVANVSDGFVTFVIFRGRQMIFFRSKPFTPSLGGSDAGGDARSVLRLIRRELQTSLLYYREKLDGKHLTRAYLRVVEPGPEAVAGVFGDQQEIAEVHWIDPRKVVDADGRLAGDQGTRLLQRLAPALGAALGREIE